MIMYSYNIIRPINKEYGVISVGIIFPSLRMRQNREPSMDIEHVLCIDDLKREVIKVGWPTVKVLYIMSVGVLVGPSLFKLEKQGMG